MTKKRKKKRSVVIQSLPVFYKEDLMLRGGFSFYKGILIQWDEDYDTRIMQFIDALPEEERYCLLSAGEHEGGLYLLWKGYIPEGYEESESMDIEAVNDTWAICTSKVVD